MSEFYIPYRLRRSTKSNQNIVILNQIIDIIEKKLQEVSSDTFGINKTIIIGASDFTEEVNNGNSFDAGSYIKSNDNADPAGFIAPLDIPDTAVVKSIKAYWFRNDAAASGTCRLNRVNFEESVTEMGVVDSNASSGFHSLSDTSISNDTIDLDNYTYYVRVSVDPNDDSDDVHFNAIVITYDLPV